MLAWVLEESPGVHRLVDVTPGPLGPSQVRVDVMASALNHIDLWLADGRPRPRHLPLVAGSDGAGVVAECGPGVTRWQPGDEVVINPSFACGRCGECLADRSVFCAQWGIMGEHFWGAHAGSVLVGEANLVPKPAGLGWAPAAGYGLAGLTAYRMLRRGRLQAGEVLLVVGAGGGVGSAALVLGRALGARTFATSRYPAKRARALELGAEAVFTTGEAIPVKADVVVDSAGAATWEGSMAALRPGGRLVLCGGTGGSRVELKLPQLFFRHQEVIGSTMGTFREFDELTQLVARGWPDLVEGPFPFEKYPEALAKLRSGEQFGKVVLTGSRR